ncbi:MAG: hypothetical protein ACYC46_13730 [Acidobacteriaceae bacterium]
MGFANLTDADVIGSLRRAMKMLAIAVLLATPVLWAAAGWQNLVLFLVGAVISATGIYEWQQLMHAVISRMDVDQNPKPIGGVLIWFFLRLGLAITLLYVSLKLLDGSIFALIAGLALALVALLVEAIRMLQP